MVSYGGGWSFRGGLLCFKFMTLTALKTYQHRSLNCQRRLRSYRYHDLREKMCFMCEYVREDMTRWKFTVWFVPAGVTMGGLSEQLIINELSYFSRKFSKGCKCNFNWNNPQGCSAYESFLLFCIALILQFKFPHKFGSHLADFNVTSLMADA